MHYLGLALYAEGSWDYHFLRPLLQRLCEAVCLAHAVRAVDVSEVLPLDHLPEDRGERRSVRVLSGARQHEGAWRVLFVHGDGSGDAVVARQNLVQPAIDALHAQFVGCAGVGVVPIRETEAWAICDGGALREVFGTTLSDTQLGIPPSPDAVEADADPKITLNYAFNQTSPSRQRKRLGVGSTLNALGGAVDLACLRRLGSFQRLEAELTEALDRIGLLR